MIITQPDPRGTLVPFILAAVLALAGCGGDPAEPAPDGEAPRTPLHVALYPYIPDAAGDGFQALLARIEGEFEEDNPDVDLTLRSFDQPEAFYDVEQLSGMLSDPPGEGGFHVVEIDTVLLGELAERDLAPRWEIPSGSGAFHPAASAATVWGGATRGVPRWMCGFYVLAEDPALARAANFDALLAAVQGAAGEGPFEGNYVSDWDLTSMYLSAWADTHGAADLGAALEAPVDAALAGRLADLAGTCAEGTANPCVDGTYYNAWDAPAERFAAGEIPAMFGYSERLHIALRAGADPASIEVGRLPLGPSPTPVAFVDALVRRPDCDPACQSAADRFAAYLTAPETYAWVLMSEDAVDAPPRYLLPAREDVYELPALASDPFYPALGASMKGAVPYPNDGIPDRRVELFGALCEALPDGAACASY